MIEKDDSTISKIPTTESSKTPLEVAEFDFTKEGELHEEVFSVLNSLRRDVRLARVFCLKKDIWECMELVESNDDDVLLLTILQGMTRSSFFSTPPCNPIELNRVMMPSLLRGITSFSSE
jgi:hypothetical protein